MSGQVRLNINLFGLIRVAKNYTPIYTQLTSLNTLIFYSFNIVNHASIGRFVIRLMTIQKDKQN